MISPALGLERARRARWRCSPGRNPSHRRAGAPLRSPARSPALRPKRCSTRVSLRPRRPILSNPMSAKDTLIEELRRHALVVGEVTLTSGATAQYYVDAKRAILRPAGFAALSELVAGFARQWEATAVGGLTMGADAPGLRRAGRRRGREGLLRAQGDQGARAAAQGRGPAAGAGRALPDRRGRRHHRRLDRPGDRGRARRGLRRRRRRLDPRPPGGRRGERSRWPPATRRTRRWRRSTRSTRTARTGPNRRTRRSHRECARQESDLHPAVGLARVALSAAMPPAGIEPASRA